MTGKSPRVTVAIPTYRGAATLGAAIESVLAQSLGDFELIVVDDCSPDETREVVARYRDPRLTYQRNTTNLGPEGNWNRCLELATGEYFKLLPHDDILHHQCLETQAVVLDDDVSHRIALVFSARDVLSPDGRVLLRRGFPGRSRGQMRAAAAAAACVRRGTNLIGEPGAVMFRRELAAKVGRFNAAQPYVIDLDYWIRLLAFGDAYYCDEPLAAFRVSGTSWSVAIGSGQSADFRRLIRRLSAGGSLKVSGWDRLVGFFTPTLNNWARLVFYRLYV